MTDPTPDPTAAPTAPRPPRAAWEHAARGASITLAAAVALGVVAAAGVASAWRSEAGTRWLLRHVPGLTAIDVRGSLGGGDLQVGSLRVIAGGTQVDVTALHLRGLALRWLPHDKAWLGVSLADAAADAVRVTTLPEPGKKTSAPTAPTSLRSPVDLQADHVRIGTLAIGESAPLRDVQAALAFGAEGGKLHRIDHLSLAWERVQASGTALVQADAPLRIDVDLAAHDAPDAATPPPIVAASASPLPHWAATATLRGPLAAFDLAASLQGQALAGRAAPQAQASARVTPFAALPVSEVLLKTSELDLSAISAHAPATRLEGTLRVATTRPAALDADLRNLAPAAWSDGGLPVASLTTRLEAPWTGESLAIPALRVVLADAKGAGGELRAQGRWEGGKAQVQLDVDQLQPERLDAHLGAWRISGPLRAEFDHLPPPASLWGGAKAGSAAAASAASATPAARASAAAPASGSRGDAGAPSAISAFAAMTAHVTGRLAGTAPPLGPAKSAVVPPPMTLQLDAFLRADALQLKQLELKAGAAAVSAQGALNRTPGARWQGELRAQWTHLDPGAWWRLADSGPLRTGTNLLNGGLALQLADAPTQWEGLAAIRGKLDVTLADSLLAGLPLDGKASLDASRAPWKIEAELHSATNQAHAEGTLSPGNAASDALAVIDQLHLAVDAPALATLAPLAGGQAVSATPAAPALPASAVAAIEAPKTIPGELLGKAATKVATGGKTSDTHALAPALAPSAAAAASAAARESASGAPAGASAWPTHGAARFELSITGGRLAIADGASRKAAPPHAPLKIVTHGELTDWTGPQLKLARLQWSGEGSTDPQAPLAATVTLVDGQYGAAHIAHADAALSGSLAEHRLQLQVEAPVSPPPWLAHLANIGDANASRLDALLQGRWHPDAVDTPAWQAHIAQFDLRAANAPGTAASAAASLASTKRGAAAASAAGAASAPPHAAWIHVQPIDLSLSRDAAGDWQTLRVGAGSVEFAGLALNWQPSFWTAPASPGAPAHWAVDAALAPFSVAQLLARAQPDLGWHGDLRMMAQLHAAFDGQWHVDGRVARTGGDLSVSELARDVNDASQALGLNAAVLQVKAEGIRWQADATVTGTRLGELSGHWTAESPAPGALPSPGSPLQGSIKAHVADLNVWGAWLPPGWRLGGEMRTDLALSGRWGAPQLTGELTAQKLVVRNALEGVYAHDGDVAIRLTGDQARIERFHMLGGNGDITLAGSANLGAVPLAKLQLQASQFQLLGRIDRKVVTSGTIGLQLGADAIRIDGKMGIDEGLFDISKGDAPTLDTDVEVLDAANNVADSGTDANAAAAVPKTGRATAINLAVDLGDKLQLRGRGIDTRLRGALQITSPNGVLSARGTIRTAGGQYTAYGQKLEVTRGEVTFSGIVNDPRLDILATRPNLDVTVGVAITGTALAPHVKLYSEPEMSDSDKLSWLMLGRAPESLGGADTALLQQAAIALLAGENEAPTDQLLKRLGLTDFAFHQQTDANDVRQTVVTLGRQVSKRVYVGYERGVNATTGNWQLIYRIAQRLTVRAQSGEDNSADVIYTWRWN